MGTKIRRIVIIVFVACLIVACLIVVYSPVRTNRQVKLDSGYRPIMGTFARIVAVANIRVIREITPQQLKILRAAAAKLYIEPAFTEIEKVDELMSDYKSSSEISELNQDGFRRAVVVSKSTYEVLQRGIEFSKLSDGAFDITIGPLVDLWRSAGEANSVPTDAELQQVRSKVGYEKLILDANEMTVRFAAEGMKIDLGGIAKGLAIDKAIEAIKEAGGLGALVDIGGDIRCYGKTPKGQKYWFVGLQNPDLESEEQILFTLKLSAGAVATSGDYQRFVVIGGRHYSHIINERTGSSAEALSSVTIIAGSATDADALATAVSVMGAEKGIELIEKCPGTEAIMVSPAPEYKITKTSGAEKFIK